MPAQDGARRDQPMHPQAGRQNANQGGKDGPVGPVQPGPRLSTAQYRDLVPQDEQFDVLGRCRAAEQNQPAADPGENQVKQTNGHGRPSCRPRATSVAPGQEGWRLLTSTRDVAQLLDALQRRAPQNESTRC
jgi:hypothetical protein